MLLSTFSHTAVLLGCIHQCCILSELSPGSMTGFFSSGPCLLLCGVCVAPPDSLMAALLSPSLAFTTGPRTVQSVGWSRCQIFSSPSPFTAPHFPTSFLKGPSEPSPLHGIALCIGLWVHLSLSYLVSLGCFSDNEVWKRDKNYSKCWIRLMYHLSSWKQRGRWCPTSHKCCIWEFSVSQGDMLLPRNETPVMLWQLWTFLCSLWALPKKMGWSMSEMFASDFGCVSYSEPCCSGWCCLCTVVYFCVWDKHMGLNSCWELLCSPHQYLKKEVCELACWTYSV